MDNPWRSLPLQPPYLLPDDAAGVEAFNAKCRNPLYRIRPEIIPEPFLGRAYAPVVLLNLNPGFNDEDLAWHEEPEFKRQSLASLRHEAQPYPFYLLNPELAAPGVRWWTQKLGALIRTAGVEKVSRSVLCVELFPYHSRRFAHARLRLPSQEYGFELVRNALVREAVIVVMRGWKFWKEAVPELEGYSRRYALRNVQNVTISPGNCPEGFEEILKAMAREG